MTDVKRYAAVYVNEVLKQMRPSENGEWCRSSDYDQLRQENERFRLALDGYKKNPDECLGDGTGVCVSHMAYEEVRARLDQAESAERIRAVMLPSKGE